MDYEPRIVLWCRDFNDTDQMSKTDKTLVFDPTTDYHTYKIDFKVVKEQETQVTLGNPQVHIFGKSSNFHEHCQFVCEKSQMS